MMITFGAFRPSRPQAPAGWDAACVFERFTERARQVVVTAQDAVRELAHPHIGTEHLLLGELAVQGGLGAWALESLGVQREVALNTVAGLIPPTLTPPAGHVPFTEGAKCALELAVIELQSRGLEKLSTEHLLLGLCAEIDASPEEDVAGRLLASLGVSTAQIRIALDPFVLDRSTVLSWSLRLGSHLEFRNLPGSAWARLLPLPADLRLRRLLVDSAALALREGRHVIEARDLLGACPVGESAVGAVAGPAGAPGAPGALGALGAGGAAGVGGACGPAGEGREWERIEAGRAVLSALIGAGRIAFQRIASGRGAEAVTVQDLLRTLRADQRTLLGRAGWPLEPAVGRP